MYSNREGEMIHFRKQKVSFKAEEIFKADGVWWVRYRKHETIPESRRHLFKGQKVGDYTEENFYTTMKEWEELRSGYDVFYLPANKEKMKLTRS